MHKSLGLLESERGSLLVLDEAAFWRKEKEEGCVSCIWNDKQTLGIEVLKGEGGDGDEEAEAVGEAVGESPSLCSVSSLSNKGVRGGTSSTSTSE